MIPTLGKKYHLLFLLIFSLGIGLLSETVKALEHNRVQIYRVDRKQTAQLRDSTHSDHLELLILLNNARQELGLPAMTLSPTLSLAAQAHAEDLVTNNYFDHIGLDGDTPGGRAVKAGYHSPYVGENIGGGVSPAQVFGLWRKSPSHHRNMLTERYLEIGIGSTHHPEYGFCWVMVFGNPP